MNHYYLTIIWIMYCIVHSLLASANFKKAITKIIGKHYKYYRLFYSIFAFLSLVPVIYFQFSTRSSPVFQIQVLKYGGYLSAFAGVLVMIISIRKYFFELSGLQSIRNDIPVKTLQTSGLHKYVRHPLYLGTLVFIWGLFLVIPLFSHMIACIIITVYVFIGIELEEKKLIMEFGEGYRRYVEKVPKIIPKIK